MIKNFFKKVKLEVYDKEFIEENKKIWKKERGDKKEIILVAVLRDSLQELEFGMRVAKALKRIYGYKIVTVMNSLNKKNSKMSQLINGYNEEEIIYCKKGVIKNIWKLPLFVIKGFKIYFSIKEKEDLLNLFYRDIKIGDLIYDTYIRNSKELTVSKNKKLIKLLVKTLLNLEIYSNILKNSNIKFLVVQDQTGIDIALLTRVAINYNIIPIFPNKILKIYNKDNIYKHFYNLDITEEELLKKYNIKNLQKIVEKYFEKRFKGEIDQFDVKNAFENKKTYSRNELIDVLSLDKNKKNILILPHCFSDGSHLDTMIYADYYTWLYELLKLIKNQNINNVNFIIKPHPSSYCYSEEGEVEKLIKELKIENIKIFPENGSTASIKNIADVILSVRGTASLEFACFGIPSINAGNGYGSDFRLFDEPKSINSYEEKIKNLDKVEKLSKREINIAQRLMYAIFIKPSLTEYLKLDEEARFSTETKGLINSIIEYNKKNEIEKNIIFKIIMDSKEYLNDLLTKEKL